MFINKIEEILAKLVLIVGGFAGPFRKEEGSMTRLMVQARRYV